VSGVDLTAILAFVNARLDEREAAARKAASGCGCHPPTPSWAFDDEATDGRIVIVGDPHPDIARKLTRRWNRSYDGLFHAAHIALNDPAYVLDDVAAKRLILSDAYEPLRELESAIQDENDTGEDPSINWHEVSDRLLCALAAPFASHPDFDPAWAVET
jgi:hypothetical protein